MAKFDLLAEFPLRVGFSGGGDFLLLFWYTYNDGQHVLLANEKTLLPLWKIVTEKMRGPKAQSLWRAHIVSPPENLRLAAATKQYEDTLFNWQYTVGSRFHRYKEETGQNPPGTKRCNSYVSRYPECEGSTGKRDKNHRDCMNCFEGFTIPGIDCAELYWAKRHVFKDYTPRTKPSHAEPANPGKDLYVVTGNFGAHSKGVGPTLATTENIPLSSDRSCFFFQGELMTVPAEIHAISESWEKDRAKEALDYRTRHDKEHKDQVIAETLALLEGLPHTGVIRA